MLETVKALYEYWEFAKYSVKALSLIGSKTPERFIENVDTEVRWSIRSQPIIYGSKS